MMPELAVSKTNTNHGRISYSIKDELTMPVRQINNQQKFRSSVNGNIQLKTN